MNSKFVFIILIFALCSCSLQKRLYNKGFYTSKQTSTKILSTDTSSVSFLKAPLKSIEKGHNSTLIAINTKAKKYKSLTLTLKTLKNCDTIVLKSGAKILANINEISPTQIKFINCGSTNEPEISINKYDITCVILSNGTKEIFETKKQYILPNTNFQPPNNANQNYQSENNSTRRRDRILKKKKLNSFSLLSLIITSVSMLSTLVIAVIQGITTSNFLFHASRSFSLTWYWIPFIIAFIAFVFSIIAIYQASKNKENQKGLTLSIISAIINFLILIGLLLFLIGILH